MTRLRHAARMLARLAPCMLALALVSCELGSQRKVTVRFWNGFTGPDGRTILRLVKQFNRANPDVRIVMQRMDWGTYYNKLFVAGMGGRAPEIFAIHSSNLERFMRAKFIRTVDDLVSGPDGIDVRDFPPNVWKAVERKGQHYAVPLDVHILGMFYNRKLFREAGIVDDKGEARPPTNREEFESAARKLTKTGSGGPATNQWGFVFTWQRTNIFTIMCQFGGSFFSDDWSKCLIDSAGNVTALQWCADLIGKQKVSPPPQDFDSWIGFRQGRVAMTFEGIYMLSDLEKQKDLDWGAAPLPVIGSTPAAWADSHSMCLRADLDDAHVQAAWRFMKFLSDNSLDWAEGGQVPVRRSLLESERFGKMTAQYQFARQLDHIRYVPRVPFIFEFLSEFDLALDKTLRGGATAQQALAEARVKIDEIIQRRRDTGIDPAGGSQ